MAELQGHVSTLILACDVPAAIYVAATYGLTAATPDLHLSCSVPVVDRVEVQSAAAIGFA
jgi:hypothetical protein